MLILQGALALLLLLPPWAAGWLWLRMLALRRPDWDGHTCLVLGGLAGWSAHLVALNASSYLWLPRHAALLLLASEGLLCLVLIRRLLRVQGGQGRRLPSWPAALKTVWLCMAPVALAWIWRAVRVGTTDQLFHAPLTEVLAVHGLPAFHPYDSTQTLVYHYGLNLLAAANGPLVGLPSWWALNLLVAALVPLSLGCCVEFLRAAARRAGQPAGRLELVLGALLFALGGNLTWLQALLGQVPWLQAGRDDFACDGFSYLFAQPSQIASWVWLLGTLALVLRFAAYRPPGFPRGREQGGGLPQPAGSLAKGRVGSAPAPESVTTEGAAVPPPGEAGQRGPTGQALDGQALDGGQLPGQAVVLGLVLAATNLVSEQAALALGAALMVFTLLRLRDDRGAVKDLLLAGFLGGAVSAVQGGVFTGMVLRLQGAQALGLVFRWSWSPVFPTQQGALHWGQPAYGRVALIEYAQTLVLAPLLLGWVFRRGGSHAGRWLLGATLPGAFLALYFRFPLNEWDTYRLYQLYFCAAMLVSGLWAAEAWRQGRFWASPGSAGSAEGEPVPSVLSAAFRRGPDAGSCSGRLAGGAWSLAGLLALTVAGALCVQGARNTVAQAVLSYPQLPWRYDPGQAEALRYVDRQGKAAEGLLCQVHVPGLEFPGQPPTPGVLGRSVAAADPGTDAGSRRGQAWLRALACPSPANLRTARTRWVCLAGADLARGLIFLEGLSGFEAHGAYPGADGLVYHLYRYGGSWEEPAELLWRLRGIERFPIHGATLGEGRLPPEALAALGDGDPRTYADLSTASLEGEGLVCIPRRNTPTSALLVSLLWVLSAEANWAGGLQDPPLRVEVLLPDGGAQEGRTWRALPVGGRSPTQVFRDPSRGRAWGLFFPSLPALAVRLRLAPGHPSHGERTRLSEIFVGRAWSP